MPRAFIGIIEPLTTYFVEPAFVMRCSATLNSSFIEGQG
jgi:hypothetical protein